MTHIVAIASGKGGVGKTWLAITLCHALASAGRRALLFDGDLGLANVDVQLGLTPGPDLGHVVSGRLRLAEIVRPAHGAGFDLIPGRSGSGALGALTPQQVAPLHADLLRIAGDYDALILDLGAGLGATVRDLIGLADSVLVVTTHEPTAITDAYALIKTHCRPNAVLPAIVVNQADSLNAGQDTHSALVRACGRFLDMEPPLAAVVRRDAKVADAIRNQTPLLTRHPGSTAARDAERLAGTVLQQ